MYANTSSLDTASAIETERMEAQSVERKALNLVVVGSSPTRLGGENGLRKTQNPQVMMSLWSLTPPSYLGGHEAERLNEGRAAMVGFFLAYVVDGLSGVGVVDQMNNLLCKTLMVIAIVGVLAIRKNEDVDNLKKLLEETTFYDKQWQATW
ncbi:light-harvesting complex-like protein 3 isotype 2, chloroplastic [Senna tora]|uniref:Light-harvesting complex-like protein 3 isotype 2, chloroplastic n=1 Tax=Senna tora TaxID=362788 RepID=A0A834SY21_9FABA|nr:light-harvesting complex-like protein 3 isotype 2, chloroplastic [Senna tora]